MEKLKGLPPIVQARDVALVARVARVRAQSPEFVNGYVTALRDALRTKNDPQGFRTGRMLNGDDFRVILALLIGGS